MVLRGRDDKFMADPNSPLDEAGSRARLLELRGRLVELHKTLIEFERTGYEATFGTIESTQRFLRLLLEDAWFAWLHRGA